MRKRVGGRKKGGVFGAEPSSSPTRGEERKSNHESKLLDSKGKKGRQVLNPVGIPA